MFATYFSNQQFSCIKKAQWLLTGNEIKTKNGMETIYSSNAFMQKINWIKNSAQGCTVKQQMLWHSGIYLREQKKT